MNPTGIHLKNRIWVQGSVFPYSVAGYYGGRAPKGFRLRSIELRRTGRRGIPRSGKNEPPTKILVRLWRIGPKDIFEVDSKFDRPSAILYNFRHDRP